MCELLCLTVPTKLRNSPQKSNADIKNRSLSGGGIKDMRLNITASIPPLRLQRVGSSSMELTLWPQRTLLSVSVIQRRVHRCHFPPQCSTHRAGSPSTDRLSSSLKGRGRAPVCGGARPHGEAERAAGRQHRGQLPQRSGTSAQRNPDTVSNTVRRHTVCRQKRSHSCRFYLKSSKRTPPPHKRCMCSRHDLYHSHCLKSFLGHSIKCFTRTKILRPAAENQPHFRVPQKPED